MAENHLFIDCPACGTANRVRVDRLDVTAKCGRCRAALTGKPLYSKAPVDVAAVEFDPLVRRSSVPILVDFWAVWCAPCRQQAPILEQLANDLAGRIIIAKVDADQAGLLASRFAVQAIPTLVLLRSGLEVDRITGLTSAQVLLQRIERYL
jgi:thioredoxin 2